MSPCSEHLWQLTASTAPFSTVCPMAISHATECEYIEYKCGEICIFPVKFEKQ